MFWIIVGVLIATFFGILLTLSSSSKEKDIPSAATPTPLAEEKGEDIPEKEITIQANEYSFFPNSFTVQKGQKVKLTFKNMGATAHNLVIDELDVATKTIGTGQSDIVEFVPDKEGTFTFYCKVGGHRDLGMEGEIEVK
jgi:plastocyanin